jgi:transcriptional regulator with PAS, ATPase and Fis domain
LRTGISNTIDDTIKILLDNMNLSSSDPILPKIEESIIKKIVEITKDKTKAASILGISKPTLYSRLKKYEK